MFLELFIWIHPIHNLNFLSFKSINQYKNQTMNIKIKPRPKYS